MGGAEQFDGAPVNATAYLARRTKAGLKPSPEALMLTKRGAEENGAPTTFIESVLRDAKL